MVAGQTQMKSGQDRLGTTGVEEGLKTQNQAVHGFAAANFPELTVQLTRGGFGIARVVFVSVGLLSGFHNMCH
jgi:hypothetical protein